jgi:ABC-type multidrug transport system fused ATPase/permease subunit
MAEKRTTTYDPEQQERLDRLVQTAFSETVRKERRTLLLVATVSLFIAVAKLIPSGTGIFGMTFSSVSWRIALAFLFFVTLYFCVSFWLYGSPEFRAARKARQGEESNRFIISANSSLRAIVMQNLLTTGRYRFWLVFEYVLPLLVGVASLIALAWRFAAGT